MPDEAPPSAGPAMAATTPAAGAPPTAHLVCGGRLVRCLLFLCVVAAEHGIAAALAGAGELAGSIACGADGSQAGRSAVAGQWSWDEASGECGVALQQGRRSSQEDRALCAQLVWRQAEPEKGGALHGPFSADGLRASYLQGRIGLAPCRTLQPYARRLLRIVGFHCSTMRHHDDSCLQYINA